LIEEICLNLGKEKWGLEIVYMAGRKNMLKEKSK
jgi:hypothetical protein